MTARDAAEHAPEGTQREHERLACVDVPALPLQLVLRQHPAWSDDPVVVVAEEQPLAQVLWANRHARAVSVRRGMRFAEARTLAARLRAAVVPPEQIRAAVEDLFALLLKFSPRVEPASERAGLFWLDPNGLLRLYPSLDAWCTRVYESLTARGLVAAVVVGYNRAFVYAIARRRMGLYVAADARTEQQHAEAVRLEQLDLTPERCNALLKLGVHTLGELLRLPAGELRPRFGEEVARLHDLATGALRIPLCPRQPAEPVRFEVPIEPADADHARLLFAIKGALQKLFDELADRCEAMTALHLTLHLDHAPPRQQSLEPAAPTLDVLQILDLVRLRLDAMALDAAVEQIDLELQTVPVHPSQVSLLKQRQRRDLRAAARAAARVAAAFGREAVTRARLRPASLPEARYGWEETSEVQLPRQQGAPLLALPSSPTAGLDLIPLVRRVYPRPVPLSARSRHEPEAWLDPSYKSVKAMLGPFRVSGGWWVRAVERDYYYVETGRGDILWLYYDRPRRRWFLHGVVD